MTQRNGSFFIFVSLMIGILLTIMPMPEWARPYRPNWHTLVLIYWILAFPQRFGVGTAWLLGITVDIMTGTLLGQHAIGLSVVAFVISQTHLRFRLFPLWQQSLALLPLLLFERAVSLWGMGIAHQPMPGGDYWISPFISILLWSWVYILLRDVRRHFAF